MDAFLGNRYEILGELGAGGMAVVYKARDLALGRVVAIKVLRQEYSDEVGFVGRFEAEARAAAALTHPNIVTIHDVGEADGHQYIVMEYVEGLSLKDLIREGPISVDRVVTIGTQVCAGLAFAHQHGIVHRDVKPQNILVLAPRNNGQAIGTGRSIRSKLTDFGIARAADAASFTKENEVVGSVQYIAPEQVQGFETGPAADIYAAGCVLYEALTGQQPFQGETSVAIAMKHIQEPPVPPRRLNPAIPPGLEAIVLQAMAKRPEDRFASAADMEAALLDLARIASERTGPMVAPPAVPAVSRVATTTTTTSRSAIVLDPPVEDDERGRFDWFLAILSALTAFWLVTGLLLVAGGALAQGTPASAAVVATPTVKSPLDPTPTQPTGPTAGATQAVSILVPSMIGLDSDRARRIVEDQGLRYTIDAREFNDDIPENGILRQDPPAGTALNRGDEVKVVLSRGVQTVAVPTLTGLTADEASRRAVDAGLTVERTEAFSDTVRSGSVISQSPAANQRVRPGTAVTLTVSRGPNRPVMPDVIGRPLNEALQILQQAGLRVPETNINRQGAEQVPDSVRARFCVGCVMSTDPVTGANIVVGQDVRIAIRRE